MTDKQNAEFVARCNKNRIEIYNRAIINNLERYIQEYDNCSERQLNKKMRVLERKYKLNKFSQDFAYDCAFDKSTTRTVVSVLAMACGVAACATGLIMNENLGSAFFPVVGAGGVAMGFGISEYLIHNRGEKRFNNKLEKGAMINARMSAIDELKNRRNEHPLEIDYWAK